MSGRTKLTSLFVVLAQRQIEDAGLAAVGSDLTSDGARQIASQMRGQFDAAKRAAEIAGETPGTIRRAAKAIRFGRSLAKALMKSGALR